MKRFGVLGSRAKRVIFGCSFFSCFASFLNCVLSYTHGFMLPLSRPTYLFFPYSPFAYFLVFMDGMYFHMHGSGDYCIAILFHTIFLHT